MYRCTECKAVYQEYPEFCDCGNDTFEEFYEEESTTSYSDDYEDDYDDYDEPVKPQKKKKMSKRERLELEEEKKDKTRALITLGVSLIIAIIVIFLPPYPQQKADKVADSSQVVQHSKLPAVETYWDTTLPSYARNKDPYYNLPILNKYFSSISPTLREYLVSIGKEFDRLWNSDMVTGNGECRVSFVINKEGGIDYKVMTVKSNNESLDDSVSLMISKITSLEIPPDDYKGEKIVISFSVKDGVSKVQFPTNIK